MFYRALKDLGIDFYVPPRKNNDCTKAEFKHKDFAYEKETDSYLCPAGFRRLQASSEYLAQVVAALLSA